MDKGHTALTLSIVAAVLMYDVNSSLFWVNCWALVETEMYFESFALFGIKIVCYLFHGTSVGKIIIIRKSILFDLNLFIA